MKTTRTLSVKDIDRLYTALINLAHPDPHDPENESHRMARALCNRRNEDYAKRNRCIGRLVRVCDGRLVTLVQVFSQSKLSDNEEWTHNP